MNAPATRSDSHFQYFPGNYRWSAEMLVVLSTAPFGGCEVSEVMRIGARLQSKVGDDEAWFDEWVKGADLRLQTARDAEAKGHKFTAAQNYLRANFYYQIADHARQPKDDIAMAAYQKSLECFRKFAALTDRPRIEVVELPSKHGAVPAYFIHAENATAQRAPCVVRFGGFDTQKEIQYLRGVPDLVRRGISCLLVDGPGQGEAIRFRGMHMRYDFDVAGTAALDYLEKRDDVDMKKIAILAMSLGGYYAPRCAAMDSRFSACIAWGPIWDYHATWVKRLKAIQEAALPVPAEHLLWATGTESYDDALKVLEGFKSGDVAGKVTVPFLLMHGEEDAQVSRADADKLFAAIASKDKTMRVFTAAEGGAQHCQRDYLTLACDTVADWLLDRFTK